MEVDRSYVVTGEVAERLAESAKVVVETPTLHGVVKDTYKDYIVIGIARKTQGFPDMRVHATAKTAEMIIAIDILREAIVESTKAEPEFKTIMGALEEMLMHMIAKVVKKRMEGS